MVQKTHRACGFKPKIHRSFDRVAPGSLQEPEEDFFTVIARGDVGALRQFMKKHKMPDGSLDFDVNCVNFCNDNAMSVAVDKGNLEMIEHLVQVMDVTKTEILLKAVHRGDLELVRGLCTSLNADENTWENPFNLSLPGEPDYPEYATPLMVAAIEGHYEIVGYLIERGHKMSYPHQPDCTCKACTAILINSDSLRSATLTYHMYSAVSSPAYIPFVTADPIHYCFQLHRRLMLLAQTNPPFQTCYKSLANDVSQFAANLVSECRSSTEVELVLKQPYSQKNTTQSEYPRLQMAIDFNQVDFIAQPKVQLVLQSKFNGTFDGWDSNDCHTLCFISIRIFTAPLAYISFLTKPKSQISAFYASPVNRMLHYVAMYMVFLGLLFMKTREEKPSQHCNLNYIWSLIIFLYFYSFTGLLTYNILNAGWNNFSRQSWNVYDLVMVTLLSLFATFSVAAMVHARMVQGELISSERKFWSKFDPQLMAEGFFVGVTVMAFLKLLFFLQLHRTFGPMLVTMYQTVKCLAWFSVFGVVVLLGYSIVLSNFYSYYSGMSFNNPETKEKSLQEESFTDVLSSFKTFYWGVFALTPYSAADVVLSNGNDHVFTELVGYVALGSFMVLILVFKSMLIALAVKSHQEARQSWLFERAKTFLYFIDMPVLPPPFNILPHRYRASTKYDMEKGIEVGSDVDNTESNELDDYKELTKALVGRYFTSKLNKKERSAKNYPGTEYEDETKNFRRSRCRSL